MFFSIKNFLRYSSIVVSADTVKHAARQTLADKDRSKLVYSA
ncbi:unnamed protein product [Enterobius vermicularis]|uniref:ATP synthase-coupling factor 6, mitochondrial n=1 Tax=Enterobius vermicularis TaxID=51028 RepID=A0A0N4VQ76_ENTVE|nr:unnamed protein product [Enterobius vermicularis]